MLSPFQILCCTTTQLNPTALSPVTNPLNISIVQASLSDSEDPDQHYALGLALQSLRSENIQIIVSGMAVNNLQDLRLTLATSQTMEYTNTFDRPLCSAVRSAPTSLQRCMADVPRRPDAMKAHPAFDDILPIFIELERRARIMVRGSGPCTKAV